MNYLELPKPACNALLSIAGRPIIGLAPMHGFTNSDFRLRCKKAGADLVYSEMVAAEAIIRHVPKALEMMKFVKTERPIIIQIFGSDAQSMAQAAQIVETEYKPDGIDINFGCPVQKAGKQGFGACQLKKIDNALGIVKSVSKVLKHTPLSMKIRLVSKEPKDTIAFVKKMRPYIKMVAIHGRTATQLYHGTVDWETIYEVKKSFPDLIVLGNGNIRSKEDVSEKLGNLDGLLIGRAAKIKPEIFKELKMAASLTETAK